MLSTSPPIQGFTTWQAEGHGETFTTASTAERVRGKVERTIFVSVMERSRAEGLLTEIARTLPIPHMIHWIETVESFGRLTENALAGRG